MTEGIQITIPDFGDDDDYGSSSIPFGRSANQTFGLGNSNSAGFGAFGSGNSAGFGAFGGGGSFGGGSFGGGSFVSGPDSPTTLTPVAERDNKSYFTSHNRGDSVTSIESTNSTGTRYNPNKSTTSFGHSSQTSIASPLAGTTLGKKSSFASLRNPFKTAKVQDAPPVPQLDNLIKSPFNRSTSSLNSSTPLTSRGGFSGNILNSPRPPTPSTAGKTKKGHAPTKSYHSQTGSIGSDGQSYLFSASPPPVPRFPNAFGGETRSATPEPEEDNVIMDPKTPSDYALHAVFIRFAASAEGKIDAFLRQPADTEPLLPDYMGPDIDTKFDETLQSLGQIAQKHSKPVVDSIMRWRKSQLEEVGQDVLRVHNTRSPVSTRTARSLDVLGILNERKSLASIYIMCRALIAVLRSLPTKEALGEAMGYGLEKSTFEQFRKPDLKLLAQSVNHRTNADLYSTLLGELANLRFVSVTDRFLGQLGPLAQGQVPKDLDMKYENLVKGLKHVQIKVWPPETFEEGAEFLESLSKSFGQAHGFRLKSAFAETLVHLIHPIGKTAQAETNNPLWAKAIDIIYPKAREMLSKPRYWAVAYPLVISSLCVAPDAHFRKTWLNCFDTSIPKLKEKALRATIMNGILRMIWTYLYRCQDTPSTTTNKLDTLLKHFFPPNRLTIFPHDDSLEPFVYITHFVLSRHFDYGKDLVLELMQEASINSHQSSANLVSVFAPERTAIAVQAILLSLRLLEKEGTIPSWPSSADFSTVPSHQDYVSSSDVIPPALLSRPGMQEFFDRFGTILTKIAIACNDSVGHMSMFDEQWAYSRINVTHEESQNFTFRRHPEAGAVAYPNNLVPQIGMLQTCFRSWPRCLHPSLPLADAVDMLLRGVIHVEPSTGDAAYDALKRLIAEPSNLVLVLGRFNRFLFNGRSQDGSGIKLLVECSQLLELWVTVVDGWIQDLLNQSVQSLLEEEAAFTSRTHEVEAGALFLLCHESHHIQIAGVKVARQLGTLLAHLTPKVASPLDSSPTFLPFIERLHGNDATKPYLDGFDELLEDKDLARLEQWRQSQREDVPLRIADSNHESDHKLWRFVFPLFLQLCMDYGGQTLATFRDIVVVSTSRYHPFISHLAGLSTRIPTGLSTRNPVGTEKDGQKLVRENKSLIDQWYQWVKILSATATLPDLSRPAFTSLGREHNRAPSEVSFERERLNTTRGLFRYLTPFLDSEYTLFRDAAVLCISSLPSSAYPQLLEDLSLLAGRQFYDDPRSKPPGIAERDLNGIAARQPFLDEAARAKLASPGLGDRSRRQERLHSAVARIYYLTAHSLQSQRGPGRQAALANVLKFVRQTFSFLTSPEMKDNHTVQRLRRYFCGTVERLFDGLAALDGSDRFIPAQMHLSIYRLCEEWCQLGVQTDAVKQRLAVMQRAVVAEAPQSDSNAVMQRFRNETEALSHAAIGALASLCQKAFSPPSTSSDSPTDRQPPEYLKPLTPTAVLDRLSAILASQHESTIGCGRKALKALILHNVEDALLLDETLRRAILTTEDDATAHSRFFEVVAELVCSLELLCTSDSHAISFAQVVCLGLSNLCHPTLAARRQAFDMLEVVHHQFSGLLTMSQFEPTIGSMAAGTYVHAHRLVSEFVAGEHPDQAVGTLAQFSAWLPQFPESPFTSVSILLLLQSLEFWIPNIQLMAEDRTGLSPEGHTVLYHLMALSLRYGRSHSEQILILWTRLIEPPNQINGHATVRFLLEQSHKVGSAIFIDCAANIVACLCQTGIGREIFEDLCTVIEPARMLPTIEHKLTFPDARELELWEDLSALFADEQPRISLGSAQFAWLFLADVSLQRYWELKHQLPLLLHAVFSHLDNRHIFVRDRARRMLFLLVRSWAPGYDELPDRTHHRNRAAIKHMISTLESDAAGMYWEEEEQRPEKKMEQLCSQVISFLEPLCPTLRDRWGTLALEWGTSCSIRAVAFRSLQIFRALSPRVKKNDLAHLLGRLSNTIAAQDPNIQSFTAEILSTIVALATSADLDSTVLPKMLWSACAALSTTVESEFMQILSLFDLLVPRIDFDDPAVAELLLAHLPREWQGPASLQCALLPGLRSSTTSARTMNLLQYLTKFGDNRIICPTGARVRDLYTVALPWCLHAMSVDGPLEPSLRSFAENIAVLAKEEGRPGIQRIMTSFAKQIFRTRDDFLRQSVSSLREFGDSWSDIITILVGLVLNSERWLRVHAMQILQVLFQQRSAVEVFGSELLMPLLRLLETDLASQALDVLEEPMTMSGGLAAKHVLRMSMHTRLQPTVKGSGPAATVFGVPEESGWCVVKEEALRATCRENVMAVFDTCQISSRPSQIEFQPEEVEALAGLDNRATLKGPDDLGGLVQNLHDLTAYFQEEDTVQSRIQAPTVPSRRLEARVAAILAKSTSTMVESDVPPTPFVDVFQVGAMPLSDDESDDDSGEDTDDDAFKFDSVVYQSPTPNGRYH